MTSFWIYAGILSAIAVGILLLPLIRQRRTSGRWSALGILLTVAVAPVSVLVYQQVTTWDPSAAQRGSEGAKLVAELAARLASKPDDVEGWMLLARSYMALGRYEEGRAAYDEAWKRTPEPSDELKVAYAESQILSDRAALVGEAGALVEDVLAANPGNVKALWYGGLVAFELGREDVVKARWGRLLDLNPPEEIATLLRQQLAALEETPGAAPGDPGNAAAAPTPKGPTVQLDVRLGEGQTAPPNASLFIFARTGSAGPPVAAIRGSATQLPGQFTLSDANAMLGGSLGDYEELNLVARVSASGQPTAQPGDLQGAAVFRPKDGGTVALVIDQVVQ